MSTKEPVPGSYASPACAAGELAPDWYGEQAPDPEQARDVARWRKARRAEAQETRAALSIDARKELAERIATHLDTLLDEVMPDVAGRVIAGYWPIKSEPDLRFWLVRLQERGAVTALPVVEVPKSPLVFLPWKQGDKMERGHWNIPQPVTTARVVPDLVLAPFLGWDDGAYRLGYGGGYFDRTLAQIHPIAVGVGLHDARLETIFPQPHDIALSHIITEEGHQV